MSARPRHPMLSWLLALLLLCTQQQALQHGLSHALAALGTRTASAADVRGDAPSPSGAAASGQAQARALADAGPDSSDAGTTDTACALCLALAALGVGLLSLPGLWRAAALRGTTPAGRGTARPGCRQAAPYAARAPPVRTH